MLQLGSLVLPVFQCCMLKNGRAWEAKSRERDCAITLYSKTQNCKRTVIIARGHANSRALSLSTYIKNRQKLCFIALIWPRTKAKLICQLFPVESARIHCPFNSISSSTTRLEIQTGPFTHGNKSYFRQQIQAHLAACCCETVKNVTQTAFLSSFQASFQLHHRICGLSRPRSLFMTLLT